MAGARNLYLAFYLMDIINDPLELDVSIILRKQNINIRTNSLLNVVLCVNSTVVSTIRIFDVISDKFNVNRIFTGGNYTQKWISNYLFIVSVNLTA